LSLILLRCTPTATLKPAMLCSLVTISRQLRCIFEADPEKWSGDEEPGLAICFFDCMRRSSPAGRSSSNPSSSRALRPNQTAGARPPRQKRTDAPMFEGDFFQRTRRLWLEQRSGPSSVLANRVASPHRDSGAASWSRLAGGGFICSHGICHDVENRISAGASPRAGMDRGDQAS
jgi:hypothetical protein